jgi:hypothetical protein
VQERASRIGVVHILAAVLLVTVSVCAGCTSDPPASPSAGATTSAATTSAEPISSSNPVTPSAAPSLTSSAVESTGPWPPGSTPEQQEAAKAAVAAFESYVTVVTAAQQDPAGRDWEPEIRKYLEDPAAADLVASVGSLAAGGVRMVEPAVHENARVTVVDDQQATVVVCVDETAVTFVDRTGQPVELPAETPRGTVTATVRNEGADKGWFVSEFGGVEHSSRC